MLWYDNKQELITKIIRDNFELLSRLQQLPIEAENTTNQKVT